MKLRLVGNTYPIKDSIKLHGGIYDQETKTWVIDAEEWSKITDPRNSRRIARLAKSITVVVDAKEIES